MAVALKLRNGFGAVARKLHYVRLTPFDTDTAEGRAHERQRRVALSAMASMVAKVISVSTALISVPLTLHYLGAEQYGMWIILSSLQASFTFADLGVGNGVLNQVATLYGRDDFEGIRRVISCGYAILTMVALAIMGLFAALYHLVPWYGIFNVKTAAAQAEAGPALGAFILCFAVAMPLGIVQKVQIGLQRGFMASLWQCAGSVIGLIGVLVCIEMKLSLFWLIFALMGQPLVAALLNGVIFFGFIEKGLSPRLPLISLSVIRAISQTGAMFFVLQIVAAATFYVDSIILAQVLGASQVPVYSVPEKLFSLIATVLAMVQAPLWPAYSEAVARGEYEWARRTLRKSQIFAAGFATACSAVLVIGGPTILHYWVNGAVQPPLMLMLGLAIWKIVEGQGNAMAMFLNGTNQIRFLVMLSVVTAVVAVTLKGLLARKFGISGTVWATTIAFSVFMLVPSIMHTRKYLLEHSGH